MKNTPPKHIAQRMQEYDGYLTNAVMLFAALHRGLLKRRLERMGITFAEFHIVGVLLRHPEGLPQKKIADLLEQTPATLSVALEKLEKKGVVRRDSDSEDSRVKTVRVNLDALDQGDEIHQILESLEAGALEGIPAGERKALLQGLKRMTRNLRNLQEKV